ncbi:MAG: phosphatase PAP2 family protein [Actinobacteria bacterium]|nr:MAG: phosphatase PAP2 family protein [Actinomycetota bacterium]
MGPIQALLELDRLVFTAVNAHASQGLAGSFFILASRVGDYGALWIAIALVVLLRRGASDEARGVVVLTLAALLLTELATAVVKQLVARPRPDEVLAGVRLLLPASGFSFPSGHASRSFAAAVVLSRGLPGRRWLLYAAAALVSLSRVVVGAHFPLDVLGGAVLGTLIGRLTLTIGARLRHGEKR